MEKNESGSITVDLLADIFPQVALEPVDTNVEM